MTAWTDANTQASPAATDMDGLGTDLVAGDSVSLTTKTLTIDNSVSYTSGTYLARTITSATKNLTFDATANAIDVDFVVLCTNNGGIKFTGNTTNAITIHGTSAAALAVVTGNDIDWDSGGSASLVSLKWLYYGVAITTGGAGVVISVVGNWTQTSITVSTGDTFQCLVAGVTFTPVGNWNFTIASGSTVTLRGSSAGHITLATVFISMSSATSRFDWVDVTGRTDYYTTFVYAAAIFVDCTFTKGMATTEGALIATTTPATFIRCTFNGGNGTSWLACDVACFYAGGTVGAKYAQLQDCTLVNSRVGADSTSALMFVDSDGTAVQYGTSTSDTTWGVGFRAANIRRSLRTRQFNVMGTSFNGVFTLSATPGQGGGFVNAVTIDASTTLTISSGVSLYAASYSKSGTISGSGRYMAGKRVDLVKLQCPSPDSIRKHSDILKRADEAWTAMA